MTGVLRIEAVNRIRAFQPAREPAREFGLGAVMEQQTVSRGDTENTKGRLTSSGAFRRTHRKGSVLWT